MFAAASAAASAAVLSVIGALSEAKAVNTIGKAKLSVRLMTFDAFKEFIAVVRFATVASDALVATVATLK